MNSLDQVVVHWADYQPLIFGYLRKHAKDETLARDLCQDVFLKVHRMQQVQHSVSNIRSWLFQIAHNTLIDHYRQSVNACCQTDNLDSVAYAEEKNAYQEMSEFIRPLLTCLPVSYAKPLALDLDGIPQKDIAQQLHLDLSATKSRIQRSRQKMQGLFYECFHLDLDQQGRLQSFVVKSDCQTLQAFLAEQENN